MEMMYFQDFTYQEVERTKKFLREQWLGEILEIYKVSTNKLEGQKSSSVLNLQNSTVFRMIFQTKNVFDRSNKISGLYKKEATTGTRHSYSSVIFEMSSGSNDTICSAANIEFNGRFWQIRFISRCS